MLRYPHASRFEPQDVPRIPVTLTPEAKQALNASGAEGRLFAQALSEHFGQLSEVQCIRLHCVPRSTHYDTPDPHPVTGAEGRILEVEVVHANPQVDAYRFHLNMAQLEELHADPRTGFRAAATATELVRLYRAATTGGGV